MNKKFKVEFIIEGTRLADNIALNREMLKQGILRTYNVGDTLNYEGNRDIDTTILNIEVTEVGNQITLTKQDIRRLKQGDYGEVEMVVKKILKQLGE